MVRRLALAISLTVWVVLLAAGVASYFTVRAILIADLDQVLFARASALPELVRDQPLDPAQVPQYDWTDTYSIRDDAGIAMSLSEVERAGIQPPAIVERRFTRSTNGQRQRSVTVRAWGRQDSGIVPVTVNYSGSTAAMDQVLSTLATRLLLVGLIGSAIAAALSIVLSRLMLGPLRSTAKLIGSINEMTLDHRIRTDALPPELKPMAERLNEMLIRIEHAFDQRKKFIANASHELRTPVAALSTTMEVALNQPRSAEEYRQMLQQCLSTSELLRNLVERLMEQVRSEGSQFEEAEEEVDVSALLASCAAVAEVLATQQSIRVIRSFPQELRCTLQANRVRSVVTNLLSNAIEYNHPGGEVELTALHDGRALQVCVRDTGMGISQEHLPHLFTPFYRADKSRARKDGHLGLGLYVVQAHVKSMKGQCHVESLPGHGSTFQVEIPCPAAEPHTPTNNGAALSANA